MHINKIFNTFLGQTSRKQVLLILLLSGILSKHGIGNEPNKIITKKVKNIILLIGDGMGVAQIYAGYTANKGKLNMERATYIGFSKTSSANNYITDSGAGATAISTGYKTNNYSIGIDKEGMTRETILETAEKKGLSTGLVVTSSVTNATPAAFISHIKSRNSEDSIAMSYFTSGIDIFIGGGRDFFEHRSDKKNISDSLRIEGYSVVYDLKSIDISSGNQIGCLAASISLPRYSQGRGDFLPQATDIALKKLNCNSKGFFIMVEGSQIDLGCHARDLSYVTSEVIDFDKAIGVAFDFADANPGTLVIVTADHETMGLALTGGDIFIGKVEGVFGANYHTAVMVPILAYGECSSEFAGIYENIEIYEKMMRLLGFRE
jgi:alkaline phosphatase